MPERILQDIWRIQIPLPGSPLKYLNSYLIKGHKRFLMIDTGMNRKECLDPMLENLERLEVDLKNTDFFITHFHSDHLGLVGDIASGSSRIYFNETEASMIRNFQKMRSKEHMNRRFLFYLHHGFPEEEFRRALSSNPAFKFRYRGKVSFSIVREGDFLEIGRYRFRCLYTPGHSPGHMCLYEPFEKILISGDHILFDITPNITCWPELGNSLKTYLRSLEKIYDLDVRIVLPGHRKVENDHRGRIRELKGHHQKRLNEIISALEEGEKSAWEVAPRIGWQINQGTWDLFPPAQKWFALGETIAHLEFLEEEGRITREMDSENKIFFKIHAGVKRKRHVTN